MTRNTLMLLLAVPALGWAAWAFAAPEKMPEKTHKLTTVSTRKLADSLHAVIAADRQIYVELVARRMQPGEKPDLPVHAQQLRAAGQSIQKRGAEFSYTLRSLRPINESHGPQTEVEQAGLEFVARHPNEAFYTEEELGGRAYFTAVYADRATLAACVDCHNQLPQSPRRDFKLGDVMGGIVIRVPLEF